MYTPKSIVVLTRFALLGATLAAQAPAPKPAFELADVHASTPSNFIQVMSGGVLLGERYQLHNATMVDLIRTAYNVAASKVAGGPAWIDWDRYDIIAKAPMDTTQAGLRLMLQALLEERFKLSVHDGTSPAAAWVVTLVGGKPKFKAGSGDGECEAKPVDPLNPVDTRVACRGVTMEMFAQWVESLLRVREDRPARDLTGLKGIWNLDFKWRAGHFFDDVEEQVGLKIEERDVPQPVLVVDAVNERPTPNMSGVTDRLPPAPGFEVASIRPTPPNPPSAAPNGPSDRINWRDDLRGLITTAWGLSHDAFIANAPKWLDSQYEVVARTPVPRTGGGIFGPLNGPSVNQPFAVTEAFRPMLRALLIERFKLATHFEDRVVDAYALTANKPKLKKADLSRRTGCPRSQAVTPPLQQITCQNMSMAQFAVALKSLPTGASSNYPVLDKTGIEGSWDITVTWGLIPASANGDGAVREPSATPTLLSNPAAGGDIFGQTFLEALEKLGLKLEKEKRREPVLVIDHIEEKPIDN